MIASEAGPWARLAQRPATVPPPELSRRVGAYVYATYAVFVVVGCVLVGSDSVVRAVVGGVIALGAGAFLLTSRLRLVLPAAVLSTIGVIVVGSGSSANVAWFATCALAGWTALRGRRFDGLAYWAAVVVVLAIEQFGVKSDPGWAAWFGGLSFSSASQLIFRRQLWLTEQLRAAQTSLAERSAAEERNRIARELHDVIAHSMTVSLLHVTAARVALEHAPTEAAAALTEAERLGREALSEVRSAVGLLREGADGTAPLPDAAGLPGLVGSFRTAGGDVAFEVHGDLGVVPATTGLAVYRIVQESLTNAAKHAPGAPVAVCVSAGDEVVLHIDSAGRPGHGDGLGIRGMRERAELLGGTCTAGPGGHGWLVTARLPT